ncbi:MAG: cytochrome c [Candidatus Eremiobacteraeota bacterium]|nr:cytochrome c [Candidatus Eremiobacteraeota bacterium]
MKNFVLGILAAVLAIVLIGVVGVSQGVLVPANADSNPGALETMAAKTSLHATIAREATTSPSPVAPTAENLAAGLKLYVNSCAACHGVSDAKPSMIAFGLYQKAPQLAKDGVEDDPEAVTLWKIQHGIRFTGMPAFGASLDERQMWQVTVFLKHMDSLPPSVKKLWTESKNPVALVPADRLPKDDVK